MSSPPPETILQFGTGKFLRAFTDLLIHEANQTAERPGQVVAVQSTGADRAKTLNRQAGRYHVAIRGLERGQPVDRVVEVTSVNRGLAAQSDWNEVLELAQSSALSAIVSNVTEAGYRLEPEDTPGSQPPRSFPAKLLLVLQARFQAHGSGLGILPCELLERNGQRLLELVLEQAKRWGLSRALVGWLHDACTWRNTLVDRIVSAPSPGDPLAAQDPLFAVAEPFALWLVEGASPLPLLSGHPAVKQVEELEPYHLRKVRILNGAHTALVAKAMPQGFETVRQAVLDPEIHAWLRSLLLDEIVPVLEGCTEEPREFAEETLERISNPFLEHRLADIALYHDVKLQTRLAPTQREYCQRFGRSPRLLDEVLQTG
jgi:tagaturonate reductase